MSQDTSNQAEGTEDQQEQQDPDAGHEGQPITLTLGNQELVLRQRFDAQFLLGSKNQRTAMRDIFPLRWRRRRLARLTMPALVVFAQDDIVCDGPAGAARAREVLPQAQVELLADSGHFVVFDRLDRVAALLGDFLAPGGPGSAGAAPTRCSTRCPATPRVPAGRSSAGCAATTSPARTSRVGRARGSCTSRGAGTARCSAGPS